MSRQNPKKTENWGGPRPKAGRKSGRTPRKLLKLSEEEAKDLFRLTKYRRALFANPDLTEEQVVASLVDAAWQEVLASYEEKPEEAQEPYIL